MTEQKRPAPDYFIIEIRTGFYDDDGFAVVARIDLSRPEFREKVLAAAGRFNALSRTRRGSRPPKMVELECGHKVKTREIAEHRRGCDK